MSASKSDIAIIGMACIFPRAPNLRSFWENLLAGVDAISDPPPGSGTNRVFDPTSDDNDRLYTKRGGYLGDIARFDPLEYGVMPRSVDGSEPEHFVALRLAHDALKDSGYLDRPFNRKVTGLILGRGTYVNRGVMSCIQHTIVVDEVVSLLKQLHPERIDVAVHMTDVNVKVQDNLGATLDGDLTVFGPPLEPVLGGSLIVSRALATAHFDASGAEPAGPSNSSWKM